MAAPTRFPPVTGALTVETVRLAVSLWLGARGEKARSPLRPGIESPDSPAWCEELRWLGVDPGEEVKGEKWPDWTRLLAPIEESEPSPWGQWSGQTTVAELRELGVLPEALINFLALLGWQPPQDPASGVPREVFAPEELRAVWSPPDLVSVPVRFDFELLRRVNHEWLQRADLDRLLPLALPYYRRVGWLPEGELSPLVRGWLRDVIRAVLPGLDFISLLPPRTRLVFDYQAENYLRVAESREALEREGAREVLRLFGQRVLEDSWLTLERFRQIVEDLKCETPWRGRNLYHPIQVLLTGLPFGPSLEELIPVFERGAELDLPVQVKSCRQRVLEFCSAFV